MFVRNLQVRKKKKKKDLIEEDGPYSLGFRIELLYPSQMKFNYINYLKSIESVISIRNEIYQVFNGITYLCLSVNRRRRHANLLTILGLREKSSICVRTLTLRYFPVEKGKFNIIYIYIYVFFIKY